MENKDLTVIFLTLNEHPEGWESFHKKILFEAIGDYPLITVSKKPLDYGLNLIDDRNSSHFNMYRQLLRATKLATTPFVATAESDTLYPKEHFNFYRPPVNSVSYDMSRWCLYTWNPVFSLKRRISNCTLIASREYLIEALEERYGGDVKCPPERVGEVGRHIHEKALGITLRNAQEVWCDIPTIQINHINGTNYREAHNPTRKRLGEIKAIEIPFWGLAKDLVEKYR